MTIKKQLRLIDFLTTLSYSLSTCFCHLLHCSFGLEYVPFFLFVCLHKSFRVVYFLTPRGSENIY